MLTNDDLLAISQLLDVKIKSALEAELQPVKDDIRDLKRQCATKAELQSMKDDIRSLKLQLENEIVPSIQLLAENYVPAAKRYEKAAAQMEGMQADIELMKMVIAEHSEKFQLLL